MILGDLLDARVVGPDGAPRGVVVDVRLELEVLEADDVPGGDHDRQGGGGSGTEERPLSEIAHGAGAVGTATVVGLLVSPRTASSFLGYERTEVRSPWPVPQLVRRLHRGTFLVRWEDVAAVGPDGVRLADGYAEHDPALDRASS